MDPSAHDALNLEQSADTPAVVIRSAGVKIEANPGSAGAVRSHRHGMQTVASVRLTPERKSRAAGAAQADIFGELQLQYKLP
jgi:hypothetical protein